MKLTLQDTSYLSAILSTCAIGGIESIIIEDGVVRGVNDARTFVIMSDYNVPKLPQKVGLSRLSSLRQRMELFANHVTLNGEAVIEAKETERGEINSIDISAKRNKVQFRCTSTILVKAPKGINGAATYTDDHKLTKDAGIFNVFFNGKYETKMILDAIKAMGGKTVQLVIKKDRTVSICVSDATNDVFTSVLSTPVTLIGEEQDSVVHCYHADIFYAVLKTHAEADATWLTIGAMGTISSTVNGHAVVVMPKVNDDSDDEQEDN